MLSVIENAEEKLDEARFFLDLMDRLEIKRVSYTKNRLVEVEFSFLLSAFLNACYSCGEQLRRDARYKETILEFRRRYPEFYQHGQDGGWRTKSVHFYPVKPKHDGYIPPPLDNIILRQRGDEPYVPPDPGSVNFDFSTREGHFYFSNEPYQNSICDLCAIHLHRLRELVDQCV